MTSARIIIGDARVVLPGLPAESVDCCVTSPPFWGQRDYGTGSWAGGNPACDHLESSPERTSASRRSSTLQGGKANVHRSRAYLQLCGRCGAARVDAQVGLEDTVGAYVANLVAILREVRRILRRDGVLWLNLGDKYAGAPQGSTGATSGLTNPNRHTEVATPRRTRGQGFKSKDLVGVPWRVAFALQEDGWWLRCDVVWDKLAGMPESVRDRPTRAHEYLFLLARSERYWYDADALREPHAATSVARQSRGRNPGKYRPGDRSMTTNGDSLARSFDRGQVLHPRGRNVRSVWRIQPAQYEGDHYAVMPSELAWRCVVSGCRPGGIVLDPFCGAGTTGLVATGNGRSFVGIEVVPRYAEQARDRIGLFASVEGPEAMCRLG